MPLSLGRTSGRDAHPLGSRGTPDSPWVRPGCRDVEVELEGAVVMAADEQVPEPSPDVQGLVAGSAEASVRSRLPLGGATPFGMRSPRPGAEKDSEKWGCKIPCQCVAITMRPRSRGSRAQGAQGQEVCCVPHGLGSKGRPWQHPELEAPGGWPWLYPWLTV